MLASIMEYVSIVVLVLGFSWNLPARLLKLVGEERWLNGTT